MNPGLSEGQTIALWVAMTLVAILIAVLMESGGDE